MTSKPRARLTAVRYADRMTIAVADGTKDKIYEAAAFEDMTPADWMRRAIRRQLAAYKRLASRRSVA